MRRRSVWSGVIPRSKTGLGTMTRSPSTSGHLLLHCARCSLSSHQDKLPCDLDPCNPARLAPLRQDQLPCSSCVLVNSCGDVLPKALQTNVYALSLYPQVAFTGSSQAPRSPHSTRASFDREIVTPCTTLCSTSSEHAQRLE